MDQTALKILQLVPQVPYPLSVGGKVGIFNITKHLAMRGHRITMLAFDTDSPVETKPLEQYCELITVPHSNKNSSFRAFVNLFSKLPYNISKYQSPKFQSRLCQLLKERRFDIVHVDHLHMAQYGTFSKGKINMPIVLREHNVESVIMERFADLSSSFVVRRWLGVQLRRIRSFEAAQAARYDCCLVITEEDRKRLNTLAPSARAQVIPGGVEARYFKEPQRDTRLPVSVSFFGNFDWIPNRDAVLWFVQDIFPKIITKLPEATLYVIGKNIPPKIKALQSKNLIVRGFVPDLKEEAQKYQMTVVPLRVGGGIRLKILESFAMRVPVVSTSVGCEGISGNHNEHLLVGDTADEFAEHVVRLLEDEALRKRLVKKAYALAEKKYRWEDIAEQFEHIYVDVIHQNKARSQTI